MDTVQSDRVPWLLLYDLGMCEVMLVRFSVVSKMVPVEGFVFTVNVCVECIQMVTTVAGILD